MISQKIRVYRSTEGTIFEVVFLVLAVLLWACIIWLISRAPDTVPTHFGFDGKPDAYGSPMKILFPCILITVVGACFMAGAYFPHTVNLPVKVSTPRQYALVVRMMRILGLLMLPLTLCIAFPALHSAHPSAIPTLAAVAVILVVCVVFTYLIYRNN